MKIALKAAAFAAVAALAATAGGSAQAAVNVTFTSTDAGLPAGQQMVWDFDGVEGAGYGVSFTAGPRFIDSLEWFASPEDIARLMIDLRKRGSEQAMAALAINNGLGPGAAEPWSYLGYKGGSENGVLSMTLLGQRKADGKWFVVTASWNNANANVDTAVFSGLVARLLALAAK